MSYPFKTKWDMIKLKDEYLNNLKLEIETDEKTYNAIKSFKRSGQVSEITDTRTLEEKLADVEKLKINLYNRLLEITDGIQANKITEQIGPNEIIFLSQNFEPIKDYIKKAYSLGVPSEIFLDYLQRYIDKYNQTRGVEFGMQQNVGNQLLLNQETIMRNMATTQNINNINNELRSLGLQNTDIGIIVRQNLQQLNELVNYLPLIMRTVNEQTNAVERANVERLLTNIVSNLPTRQELERFLINLQTAKEQQDKQKAVMILEGLDEIMTRSNDVQENIEVLKSYAEQQTKQQTKQEPEELESTKMNLEKIYENNKSNESLRQFISNTYKNGKVEEISNKTIQEFIKERFPKKNLGTLTKEQLKVIIKDMVLLLNTTVIEDNRKISGGSIVLGVNRQNKLIPFGKYMINQPKLEKNIVTIKRKGGSVINNLPSQRVSNKVGNILRKIIGGGNPTYDELHELSDEEKRFLHKVSTMSEIDKVLIATPDKTKEEKLINEFEIMKGQILAGNDNEEIVKKFKVLILKLSKMGLLPRTEVNTLLMDLINLGH